MILLGSGVLATTHSFGFQVCVQGVWGSAAPFSVFSFPQLRTPFTVQVLFGNQLVL